MLLLASALQAIRQALDVLAVSLPLGTTIIGVEARRISRGGLLRKPGCAGQDAVRRSPEWNPWGAIVPGEERSGEI